MVLYRHINILTYLHIYLHVYSYVCTAKDLDSSDSPQPKALFAKASQSALKRPQTIPNKPETVPRGLGVEGLLGGLGDLVRSYLT